MSKRERRARRKAQHTAMSTATFLFIVAVLFAAAVVPLQALHDAQAPWRHAFQAACWVFAILALLIAGRITALVDRKSRPD